MTRVVLDPVTIAQFNKLQQTAEICDQSGHVLGHFVPKIESINQTMIEPTITDDELARREKAGGGRSLSEILN